MAGPFTVVKSLAGRDEGRLFLVLEEFPEYVSLADGRLRRVEKPKRKKVKHTKVMGQTRAEEDTGKALTNSRAWKLLAEFAATADIDGEGSQLVKG